MIFVTVGTDLPFNRLVEAVDKWAQENNRTDIFAQIGETDWTPSFIQFKKFLEPDEFQQHFQEATCIVSHAGMGTILSALNYKKPILVMPRRATLGEQRNEHQLATAGRLNEMEKINVAFDEGELLEKLRVLNQLVVKDQISAYASSELIGELKNFISY